MNALFFKYHNRLFYFLSLAVFVLVLTTTLLYRQKHNVVQQNRSLILQNDSILSENIYLKNYLRLQVGSVTGN